MAGIRKRHADIHIPTCKDPDCCEFLTNLANDFEKKHNLSCILGCRDYPIEGLYHKAFIDCLTNTKRTIIHLCPEFIKRIETHLPSCSKLFDRIIAVQIYKYLPDDHIIPDCIKQFSAHNISRHCVEYKKFIQNVSATVAIFSSPSPNPERSQHGGASGPEPGQARKKDVKPDHACASPPEPPVPNQNIALNIKEYSSVKDNMVSVDTGVTSTVGPCVKECLLKVTSEIGKYYTLNLYD